MASFADFGNDLYSGKRSIDFVGKRRRWFTIGAVLIVLSVVLLLVRGLNPGIDFRGGSEFTVSGAQSTEQQLAHDALAEVAPEQTARVSVVGNNSVRVQTEELTDDETTELRQLLAEAYGVDVSDVTASFVGPTWGQSVTNKALTGLVIFLVLVGIIMALYFRRWTMAAAALIALGHDLILTIGLYAGVGFEVTPASVIGLLTILGYSLYDTVVVFDKVRENTADVFEQSRYTYAEAANLAVNQTLVRSINTSVLAIMPVASILFVGAFLLGAGTLRDIALALFIGMVASTLSSVFIASPMEVTLLGRNRRVREHTAKVLASRAKRLAEAEERGEDAADLVGVAPIGGLVVGSHQGQAAQPKRRRRRR